MFAQAIPTTGGGCTRGDRQDFTALLRAMTGRGSGERGRHRRHGHGRGPAGEFGGFPFGGFGPGGPRGRGRKARRGDIRTAALLLLAEEPRNGYQIMQEVEERSDGVWRPSPGSVYPALQQLEDEGLIRSQETDGRKLFALTDEGRAYIEKRDESDPAPWKQMSGDISEGVLELRTVIREVWYAFVQIMRTGSEAQMTKARDVLADARRELYRILADGHGDAAADEHSDGEPADGPDADDETTIVGDDA
jgi:DNA-binding PadR family transcriptional regulator